jgi:hypothetical protein
VAGELTPPKIDRAALERIIQRAAELQAGEVDTGDGLNEQEVLKLGGEVGIPGRFLRQALYEETTRGGVERAHGFLARWIGPKLVGASRVVPGEKTAVEPALEQWMSESEAMTVKRRLPDRTLWEPQKGLLAQMKRGLGMGGKSYHLARAVEVSDSVTPLEQGYCHVALSADVSNTRGAVIAGVIAVAGTGALASAIALAALPIAIPLLALVPGALGVGLAAGLPRAHRRQAERVQLALEQILDGLERGEIRPQPRMAGPRASAFVRIADEIKRSLVDVAETVRQIPPPPPKRPSLPKGKD